MALNISYIKQEAPSPKVAVDQRLYRTADGTRLVPEGHPDAAFLYCTPGHEVSREEFERFELDPSLEAEADMAADPESEIPGTVEETEGEPEGEPETEESDRGEDEGAPEGPSPDAEAPPESEAGEQAPEGESDPVAGEAKEVEGPPQDKAVRKRRTKKAKG